MRRSGQILAENLKHLHLYVRTRSDSQVYMLVQKLLLAFFFFQSVHICHNVSSYEVLGTPGGYYRCPEFFSRPGKGVLVGLTECQIGVRTKFLEKLVVGQGKSGQKSTKSVRTNIAKFGLFGI